MFKHHMIADVFLFILIKKKFLWTLFKAHLVLAESILITKRRRVFFVFKRPIKAYKAL